MRHEPARCSDNAPGRLIVWLASLLACSGCGSSGPAPQTFLVGVISDTHVFINDELQNNQRFIAVGELLSGMETPPAFVVNTGDAVEDLLCIPGVNCEPPLPVLVTYRRLIEGHFAMPVYTALGNHDHRYLDSFGDAATPEASWLRAFAGSGLMDSTWFVVEREAMAFVILNGSAGAIDYDTNDQCSFGDEQLAWLEAELALGRPSVLFWHQDCFPDPAAPDPIHQVIARHRRVVRAVFVGHGHYFRRTVWEGVPFYETDNLKLEGGDDPDALPHHLLLCDPGDGSVTVMNEAEINYQQR